MQTATTTITTARPALGPLTPSTTIATEPSPQISTIRTLTRPTRSGRRPPRAATSQSSETGREEGSPFLLTITTTWGGVEGAVSLQVWLSARWREKSPQQIREAFQASVLEWTAKTAGSTLEALEVEEEAREVHLVVAPVELVMEVVTVATSGETGPPQKIGSDGTSENISDDPPRPLCSHPHIKLTSYILTSFDNYFMALFHLCIPKHVSALYSIWRWYSFTLAAPCLPVTSPPYIHLLFTVRYCIFICLFCLGLCWDVPPLTTLKNLDPSWI